MPLVPSLNQVLSGGNMAQVMPQPSPTGSSGSLPARRSPPAISRISPTAAKLSSTAHMPPGSRGDHTPERIGSPPPLLHTQSTPVVPQVNSGTQQQIGMLAAAPRPVNAINRALPPQFLKQYQTKDERWQVTEELLAEIERADQQQGQLQGTSGVAYAGGAASSSLLHQHREAGVKDPVVDRVRAADRSSPKEIDGGVKRQSHEKERESPKTRERSQTTSSTSSAHDQLEYRGSPPFLTPLSSPGERTAGYGQYLPDTYQQQPQPPPQGVPRKPVPTLSPENASLRSTPPGAQRVSGQTPPSQARATDRALPLQEEQEEDLGHEYTEREQEYEQRHHESPQPSSDSYTDARYDDRRERGSHRSHSDSDDDDMTLNEEVQEQIQQKSEGEESSGFTPRSPTSNLPERPGERQYSPTNGGPYPPPHASYSQATVENQKTLRPKHRVASTDQMGMRSLDPTMFDQQPGSSVKTNGKTHPRTHSLPEQDFAQLYSKPSKDFLPDRVDAQPQPTYTHSLPNMSPHFEDLQGLFDVPTSSYLQHFFPPHNSRPGAPVPPTPQSHTAAPSPSPLSAMPSDIEPRQVGSPYPYPFTHIRRTALSAAQNAPSSTFDHNNPDVVREQLALQMQIYALNNGLAPPSDTTFSPSSTPFPGVGYNPWAIMQQMARPGDSTISMRSSPSHEPIPMPMMPPMRGRGLRRKDNATNLRAPVARHRVKPPPRVESTQPRETSPEPSSGSGEETAGEEQFVAQYISIPQNGNRANGQVQDDADGDGENGEWVDEEEEEDDLLQLEYHPTYINSLAKRRRRWQTRWDALTEAVQVLDRETDATVIVLAAPSHTAKLHVLTSRSIRRDPNLLNSAVMGKIRSNFSAVAARRRATRTRRVSLLERLSSAHSASSATASQGGETREEDLRRSLETALGSLDLLQSIHEQREARWRNEMKRLSDDQERIRLLLSQTLGPVMNGNGNVAEHTLAE